MKIGHREVIANIDFICPGDETASFDVMVEGSPLQIETKFEKDEESKKAKIKASIVDSVVKITFFNWHQPLGVMTPYSFKVASFKGKTVSVAAHGSINSNNHHIFIQFMTEDQS